MTGLKPAPSRVGASSPQRVPASYVERRAALRWPLVVLGLVAPGVVCAVCLVLAVVVNPAWSVAAVCGPLVPPFLMYTPLLYRNWPSAIRVDAHGVRIGAVYSPRAARRTPSCARQAWGLFVVPWSEIASIDVVEDPARIRALRSSRELYTLCNRWAVPRAMARCKLGVLLAPFSRAVLVVEVWTGHAAVPETRPVTVFRSGALGSWLALVSAGSKRTVAGEVSGLWIAPTRRPQALRAAVRAWARHVPPAEPARFL